MSMAFSSLFYIREEKKEINSVNLLFYISFFFLVFYLIFSFADAVGIFLFFKSPAFLFTQPFYIRSPPNCTLLMDGWDYTIYNMTTKINLPKFDQSSKTTATFKKQVSINESYNKLKILYASDEFYVYINGSFIDKGWWSFSSEKNEFYYPFKPGEYTIDINVVNDVNVGGIGQVMLCRSQ